MKRKGLRAICLIVFVAATILFVFAALDHWRLLTLILPFIVTSFVKATDII